MKITLNNYYRAGLPGIFKRDSWGLPPAAQPSPALHSPAPSTSTCLRRAAKAKARGNSPGTMGKFCQVDGSRTLLVWLAIMFSLHSLVSACAPKHDGNFELQRHDGRQLSAVKSSCRSAAIIYAASFVHCDHLSQAHICAALLVMRSGTVKQGRHLLTWRHGMQLFSHCVNN